MIFASLYIFLLPSLVRHNMNPKAKTMCQFGSPIKTASLSGYSINGHDLTTPGVDAHKASISFTAIIISSMGMETQVISMITTLCKHHIHVHTRRSLCRSHFLLSQFKSAIVFFLLLTYIFGHHMW